MISSHCHMKLVLPYTVQCTSIISMYKTIVKKLQKSIKDTLRTFQPGICKNLRTSQPQKKFTGPYKKKRV